VAVYCITGGLGSGKSLIATSRIRDALQAGVPVATNMNINLEYLVAGRRPVYDLRRLPDYPKLEDFKALGDGSRGKFDEKKFGWIVLDEVATFLNSREWNRDLNDEGPKEGEQKRAMKTRMDLIKWLRHCRKHRWHLMLITQGVGSLDSQVRNELLEHEVRCRRMDRFSVPVVSTFSKVLGFGEVPLPQVHAGVVYYMETARPERVTTWFVPDAKSLHPAYDTAQKLNGECLGYTVLDGRSAPYLWEPRGLLEVAWKAVGWRWWRPSVARQRYDDFRLARSGVFPTVAGVESFAAWMAGRAALAGALGGEAGEAPEPALERGESYLEVAAE